MSMMNGTGGRRARRAALASGVPLLVLALGRCSADGGGAVAGGGSAAAGGTAAAGGQAGSGGSAAGAGQGGGIGLDVQAGKDYTAEEYFVDDPPPQSCDGGANPTAPGGTPECPDDKNLEGCRCPTIGATAPCWPGYRRNRNRGDCADGMTTCSADGERLAWGPCQGFTGVDPNTYQPLGATGGAACQCFSGGYWRIENLSPCFFTSGANVVAGAVSTIPPGACPAAGSVDFTTGQKPTQAWSANSVTADCTGFFELCFTLKALSAPGASPAGGDCTMQRVCSAAYYGTANVAQPFPDLPSWITSSAEQQCAQRFVDNGGYAEMSVDGTSDECDRVQKTFQTVTYCPLKCADPANAQDPECANCTNGGGGPF